MDRTTKHLQLAIVFNDHLFDKENTFIAEDLFAEIIFVLLSFSIIVQEMKDRKCSMNIFKMKIESENEIKFWNGTRGRTFFIHFIKLYSLDKFRISDRWEQWTMVFWLTILICTRFYFVYFLFNCRNGEWNSFLNFITFISFFVILAQVYELNGR